MGTPNRKGPGDPIATASLPMAPVSACSTLGFNILPEKETPGVWSGPCSLGAAKKSGRVVEWGYQQFYLCTGEFGRPLMGSSNPEPSGTRNL